MKTKKLIVALVLVGVFILAMTGMAFAAETETVAVTVFVKDSTGAPLSGVAIDYADSRYTYNFGVTGDDGKVTKNIKPGSYQFKAKYNGTASIKPAAIDAKNYAVYFETANITVEVKSSKNEPVKGVKIQYTNGYTYNFGTTGEDGTAKKELFPGTYSFTASHIYTKASQGSVEVENGSVVTFQTKNVKLHYSGNIIVIAGGYANNYSDYKEEMFPGTYEFRFSGKNRSSKSLEITVPEDSNVEKSIAYVTLLDSKGNGIEGATVNYYVGGWHNNQGKTDAKGIALVAIDGSPSKTTIQVNHKGGNNQKQQNIKENSFFDFQTKLVTVKLVDSKDDPIDLDNYTAQFYAGKWQDLDKANDGYQVELLPASYSFGVRYRGGWNQQDKVNIASTPEVVFQTGAVKINFSGTTKYYSGGWYKYTDQVELLPGTYRFTFGDSSHMEKPLDIKVEAGKLNEKTIAYLRVLKSDGKTGQSGFEAKWHIYGGTDSAVEGTTDNNGILLNVMDGHINKNTIYTIIDTDCGAEQSIQQNPSINSFFIYRMAKVEVQLVDNEGNILAGANPDVTFWAYGKSESPFGTMTNGKVSKDLLTGVRYLFKIPAFNGGSYQTSDIVINSNPQTIIIKTGKVVDNGFGCIQYWQYGKTTSTFPENGELYLLPGTYFFKNGTSQIKEIKVQAGDNISLN